jgi:hypothetical protein
MAARFVVIGWEEMHGFLVGEGFKLLNPSRVLPVFVLPGHVVPGGARGFEGTVEVVYGKRVNLQGDSSYTLRVYTSVTPREGESREKGGDAIRVVLFHRHVKDGKADVPKPCGGERRCHRVAGWRKNLGERLAKWREEMVGPRCWKCRRPMVERDGTRGKFWGCTGYAPGQQGHCDATMNVGQEQNPGCPECSRPMVKRNGQKGPFWGCQSYPACRGTRPVAA